MSIKLRSNPPRLKRADERLKVGDSWRAPGVTTSRRGYGARWQRERVDYLDKHPLCVRCAELGVITSATVVDHTTPHQGNPVLFWNQDNWQALCATCHSSWKQSREWHDKYGR